MGTTRFVAGFCALLVLGACASTPKTVMLVPGRETVAQLEALGAQTGLHAQLLTTRREMHWVTLARGVPGSLSGVEKIDEPARAVPFDELALVYHTTGPLVQPDKYPLLPAVGPAESAMGCDQLEVAVGRAAAIRWYARQQGAKPFTAHEVTLEHTKTGLKAVGYTALAVLIVGGCSGGGCGGLGGGSGPPPSIEAKAFRWAVTRADQRELGLLRLELGKHCTARVVNAQGTTEFDVLAQIEDTQQALRAGRLAEPEQMKQQTFWLDALEGDEKGTAAVYDAKAEDDLMGRTIGGVVWRAGADAEHHGFKTLGHFGTSGQLAFRADSMVFLGADASEGAKDGGITVPYESLANVVVASFGRWRGLVLDYRDGHTDTVEFDGVEAKVDREQTLRVRKWLAGRIGNPEQDPTGKARP